jgi:hypothetical protein
MQRSVKMLFLSALLIVCAPFGVRHAEGERESNDKAEAAETSLERATDFTVHLSAESLELSKTSHATQVARQLQVIPFASRLLFLKEYSEIEE